MAQSWDIYINKGGKRAYIVTREGNQTITDRLTSERLYNEDGSYMVDLSFGLSLLECICWNSIMKWNGHLTLL